MPRSEMILTYITCKDKSEARKISEHLLKKRLIVCDNIFPIESMHWWKDKIKFDEIKGVKGKLKGFIVMRFLVY